MHIFRALACALALLVGPGFAADKLRQQEPTTQQSAVPEAERTEAERLRLKVLGYELRKPFRDCPDCPEMLVIPSGTFDMGSPADEVGRYGIEAPLHRVTVGKAFAMGKTEVTQGQWRTLMGSNPSHFSACGDDCPVERVNWNDAQEYLLKLSTVTGKHYRLPSEAEWEYAARAGMATPFNTGNCINTAEANYDGSRDYNFCRAASRNFRQRTMPVGSFAANGFGLHDMHGNVSEWVEDCWHEDYQGAPADGSAWSSDACDKRVLRGGSWRVEPRSLRSAERNGEWAAERGNSHGFRIARTLF